MEDYKQRYERALEIAKVVNPGTKDYNIVTTIFPELKESNDERIRKELLDYLDKRRIVETPVDIKVKEEWISWLEKQGNISLTKDELEALRIAAYEPTKNWSEKLQSLHEKLTRCKQIPWER